MNENSLTEQTASLKAENAKLKAENQKLKAERDMAIEDIKYIDSNYSGKQL